jgi:hypothetical protein
MRGSSAGRGRTLQSGTALRPGPDEASVIGFRRATGSSRVPDPDLVQNPSDIGGRAQELANRVSTLEERESSQADGYLENIAEWEDIVGQFRVLSKYRRAFFHGEKQVLRQMQPMNCLTRLTDCRSRLRNARGICLP